MEKKPSPGVPTSKGLHQRVAHESRDDIRTSRESTMGTSMGRFPLGIFTGDGSINYHVVSLDKFIPTQANFLDTK